MDDQPIDKYRAAEVKEKEARERLQQIIGKKAKAAEDCDGLAGVAATAQSAAESAMQDYLVGKIGEDELAAARKAAETADSRHREAMALATAISEALTLQRQAVEDATRARERALGVFWRSTLAHEQRRLLEVAGEHIRRVYALALRLATAGGAYKISPRSVTEDALDGFVITDDARGETLAGLAKEYGVPIR